MRSLIFQRSIVVFVLSFFSIYLFADIPAGYYYFSQYKKGAELKTSLSKYSSPLYVLEYGGGESGFTWEGFSKVDRRSDGSVWDMYSDSVRYFDGYKAVSGMHIEHSLPKSWWGGYVNNAYRDLFHLYPADGITNSTKNDLPLGEVEKETFNNGVSKIGQNGFGNSYRGNCFEPADEYKGDFARSYFYIATMYESFASLWHSPMMSNNTYPVWQPWAQELLLKWHQQDPVSAKEIARNEAIYTIQGNRNPFIDYPELATYIWGDSTETVFPFPIDTEAFLLYPRIGTSVDFGVILQNNTNIRLLALRGVNLNDDITLSLTDGHQFELSTTQIVKTEAETGTNITMTFAPKNAGTIHDTLVISGGGIVDMRIPLKALASKDFITLEPTKTTPVGGTLQWISDTEATDYQLSVYKGDSAAGDLIISIYMECSTGNNKAIELYNGTGKTIDLSHYSLRKQSNGSGSFGVNYKLSGALPNNSTYTIVHSNATNEALRTKGNTFNDSIMNFNGNDAIALYRNGLKIDVVGYADDGGINNWGDELTLIRKTAITHPSAQYDASEWDIFPKDDYDNLGAHTMSLTHELKYTLYNQSVGKQNTYDIDNLEPENTYTYSVTAITPSGNKRTVNTSQIHTTKLDAPVALLPTDITDNSFTANWEETPYATGYLFDVYTLHGNGYTTDSINFNDVGRYGKPLPANWSGTASGNYTTDASSGISPNSLALKNSGEFIQTKQYDSAISALSFMYRFPSSGAGNILVIDMLQGEKWNNIDSIPYSNMSKHTATYTFTAKQNVRAFKWTFLKIKGNLALDDIAITYGAMDTVYTLQNTTVATNFYSVTGLNKNSTYYYTIRAMRGEAFSQPSETIMLQTLLSSNTLKTTSKIRICNEPESIRLQELQPNDWISVYSLSGVCLFQKQTTCTELEIPIKQNGIYLVQIQNATATITLKVMR